jgi:hypothetical protein
VLQERYGAVLYKCTVGTWVFAVIGKNRIVFTTVQLDSGGNPLCCGKEMQRFYY